MTQKTNKNTLIIFLKYPESGKVKTRLAKDIGNNEAARIYSLMALNIIESVVAPECYNTIIFYDPPEKEQEIKNWVGKKEIQYAPQAGNTLGDRISNAFKAVFSSGIEKAVIIGTDCLDVSSDIINVAIHLLDETEVVLGPAEDGGYYLLGLNKYEPQVFQDIDWSTEHVLEQTVLKIVENKLTYHKLKTLKDIDTVEDINDQFGDILRKAQ
ncbi:MAG: TIGR04282 family arsenosugar biosynthesis glycosyltransferase [Thermodesulfobacteriota bacterium]